MSSTDTDRDPSASGPYALDTRTHHGDWQYPAFHAAHRQHRWASVLGMRAFIRHDDVHALLKDGKHLREPGPDLLRASGITDGPLWDWWALIMFTNEGERHRRLRTLVNKAFAAHSVESLRPAVVGIVNDLGDRLEEQGEFDAIREFAHWIPARTVCHFLGIPEADVPIFERWSSDLGKVFSLTITPETRRLLDESIAGLSDYVRDVVSLRRRQPREDLVSALIAARDGADRLSEEELIALVANIILGGHDTTRCGIGCAVHNLTRNPEQWALLCREPARVEAAAEESLRRDPAVVWLMRTVTEAFTLAGLGFEPGETLVVSPMGANHDPDRFRDSSCFDIGRVTDASLSFGIGPHFCIGSAIARMEMHEAIRMLVQRFPTLQGVDETVDWTPLFEFRTPAALRVRARH